VTGWPAVADVPAFDHLLRQTRGPLAAAITGHLAQLISGGDTRCCA
jgi:hypothetical protein